MEYFPLVIALLCLPFPFMFTYGYGVQFSQPLRQRVNGFSKYFKSIWKSFRRPHLAWRATKEVAWPVSAAY